MKEIIWAKKLLSSIVEIQPIVKTPYSQVYRLKTEQEAYYLKINNSRFNYEHKLTSYLYSLSPENILEVVYQNDELNCFITQDGGSSLAQHIKTCSPADVAPYVKPLFHDFLALQFKVDLKKIQALDVREILMEDLGQKFKLFLNNATIAPALKNKCLSYNHQIEDTIGSLKEKGINNGLEHGDFNVGNILLQKNPSIDTHHMYIDWAEATITNPLFSFLSFLYSLCGRMGLDYHSELVEAIIHDYTLLFMHHYPLNYQQASEVLNLSHKLHGIYTLMTLADIMVFSPHDERWRNKQEKMLLNVTNMFS